MKFKPFSTNMKNAVPQKLLRKNNELSLIIKEIFEALFEEILDWLMVEFLVHRRFVPEIRRKSPGSPLLSNA